MKPGRVTFTMLFLSTTYTDPETEDYDPDGEIDRLETETIASFELVLDG